MKNGSISNKLKIEIRRELLKYNESFKSIGFSDYSYKWNERKVLDILPNRKKEYLIQYFTHCNNRHSVEFVISDMYEPYLLVTKIMFPKSKFIVDQLHYTLYSTNVLDDIRIIDKIFW